MQDRLATIAQPALHLLNKVIEDESAPPHLRVRAALAMLDRLPKPEPASSLLADAQLMQRFEVDSLAVDKAA